MWYSVDPEELKNYQCRTSLKKLKENLLWRYSYHEFKNTPNHSPLREVMPILQNNLWFTGISSNPLLSLEAHGVDSSQSSKFLCLVIPVKYAQELKATVLAMEQFHHAFDDASDYIAKEQPYTYLYSFLVEKGSIFSIDSSCFTPLKYIPSRPAQIFVWYTDKTCSSWKIETKDRDSYPEVLEKLLKKAKAGKIARLLLRCQEATIMQCDFLETGYDLLFDACTSQSGCVYYYIPEEHKQGDWEILYSILLYFMRFYKKQKGTRWKYVRRTMVSENMHFEAE